MSAIGHWFPLSVLLLQVNQLTTGQSYVTIFTNLTFMRITKDIPIIGNADWANIGFLVIVTFVVAGTMISPKLWSSKKHTYAQPAPAAVLAGQTSAAPNTSIDDTTA